MFVTLHTKGIFLSKSRPASLVVSTFFTVHWFLWKELCPCSHQRGGQCWNWLLCWSFPSNVGKSWRFKRTHACNRVNVSRNLVLKRSKYQFKRVNTGKMSLKMLILISSALWLSPFAALGTSHCTDVSEWGPVRFFVHCDVVCVSLNEVFVFVQWDVCLSKCCLCLSKCWSCLSKY